MFETVFIKNEADKTLTIERQFAASKEKVWTAWTDSKILEKWWAPEPYKAVTESFSFTEGGKWHYYMAGPNNEKHWSMMEYESINPQDNFTAWDSFADDKGNRNTTMPVSQFKTEFIEKEGQTRVKTVIIFKDVASMNQLMEMGMAEGLAMGHRQLDAVLAQ
ncbi:MAG TPA: SRPBCC domain-containing protein [Vitreimonas sp.]|nr:SRPBCC domain-containing protein [Vitreimonas sp.]